jgi:HSP20 family protein
MSENQQPERVIERTIPCDVFEGQESFLILADLPGVTREGLTIDVHGHTLLVRGERRIGREHTRFERRFTLPDSADVEQVHAVTRDGVVRVEIHKTQRSRPRRIQIQG